MRHADDRPRGRRRLSPGATRSAIDLAVTQSGNRDLGAGGFDLAAGDDAGAPVPPGASREWSRQVPIFAANGGAQPATVTLMIHGRIADGTTLGDLLGGAADVTTANGPLVVTLPGKTAALYRPR